MRRSHRTAFVLPSVLVVILALGGCGSGEETGGDAPIPLQEGGGCEADVTLSGGIEASWSDEATVTTSDSDVAPPATYQSADGDTVVTVSAPGNGFEAIANVLSGDRAFTLPLDDPGIEAQVDGSGATLVGEATDPLSQDVVQVEATFSC